MKIKLPGKDPKIPAKPSIKPEKGHIPKKVWKQIKADYIAKNLDPTREKGWTYKDVSLAYDIPFDTVKHQAQAHQWNAELAKHRETLEKEVAAKLIGQFSLTEADIRIRQQKVSAAFLDKAYAALQAIDADQMTAKDAINLARLGLTQERAAVGLADRIDYQDLSQPTHQDHESPLAKMEAASKKNALADKLLKFLDEDDGEGSEEEAD